LATRVGSCGNPKVITKSSIRNWNVFLLMVLLTGGAALAWLYSVETTDTNIRVAVRHSAAFAFLFYLISIAARPLHQLLHKPWSATVLKNRRLFGVAFAGIMTAHLMLIIMRFTSTPGLEYPMSKVALGGSVYAIIYLMFITSFDRPASALGPKAWKLLHRTGLIAIAVVFALPRSLDELSNPEKLKFAIPVLAVILMRIAVLRRSKQQDS
jgi:sulfoxide reductase heme-binding subunit YedZ